MDARQEKLRKLPAISAILEQGKIKELEQRFPHVVVAEAATEVIQNLREAILNDPEDNSKVPEMAVVADLVERRAYLKARPSLKRVINATGIILHTNLGRAVLAREAVEAINDVAGRYSNVELDLTSGERGTRYAHIEELLCRLTGAEAGLVVNNNAGAVLLVLSTLASGKEVIVSRGQLVEIGGSFRIPDVMTQSGAKLVEVGTTNKTHLLDYEQALSDETAVLLKVHTSNYKIIGFTSEVPVHDLVAVGKARNIPVVEDLGSGVLIDFARYGVAHEPTVKETVAAGADVVTCSGDKLFGGPQAGLIVGRKHLIDRMKKNPLTRALRIDKFTLAAMEATLRLYLDEDRAVSGIPTLNMITMSQEDLHSKADYLADRVKHRIGDRIDVSVIEGYSHVGGGALPEENIPTFLVSLKLTGLTVNETEAQLREMEPPVLARIQKDRLLIDPRTLLDDDGEIIIAHLAKIIEKR